MLTGKSQEANSLGMRLLKQSMIRDLKIDLSRQSSANASATAITIEVPAGPASSLTSNSTDAFCPTHKKTNTFFSSIRMNSGHANNVNRALCISGSKSMLQSPLNSPNPQAQMVSAGKRCRSASGSVMRKRLDHAVEKGKTISNQTVLLRCNSASAGTLTAGVASPGLRKPSVHHQFALQPSTISANRDGCCRSSSLGSIATEPPSGPTNDPKLSVNGSAASPFQAAAYQQPHYQTHAAFSSFYDGTIFKSSAVRMEIELKERMDSILLKNATCSTPQRAANRLDACAITLDQLVVQDTVYGGVITKIRNEVRAVANEIMTLAASRNNHHQSPDRDHLNSELAQLRRENTSLREQLEFLQQALAVEHAQQQQQPQGQLYHQDSDQPQHQQGDDEDQEFLDSDRIQSAQEELYDVLLCTEDQLRHAPARPLCIPRLDFNSLSPYNSDEDEDADDDEYQLDDMAPHQGIAPGFY